MSVQGLSPGDVEQILLRWEILGKEVVQALQVKTSLCHVKTRITFCSARYNGTTLHQTEHVLLNDSEQDCFEEIPNWSSQDKAKIITMSQINTLNISATRTSKTTNRRTKRNRTNKGKKEKILITT